MGRSQESFNKKEVRNKKEKKRKEKEKKRLARKEHEKKSSLDDMIALAGSHMPSLRYCRSPVTPNGPSIPE